MPVSIPNTLISKLQSEEFRRLRDYSGRADGSQNQSLEGLSIEALEELEAFFVEHGDKKQARAVSAVKGLQAGGTDVTCPSYPAFLDILRAYLQRDAIEGWVFVKEDDGLTYPYLVTGAAEVRDRHDNEPKVCLTLAAYGAGDGSRDFKKSVVTKQVYFHPGDVANRKVSNALLAKGILKETTELHADHEQEMVRHLSIIDGKFAEQYRATGNIHKAKGYYSSRNGIKELVRRKVINDLSPTDYAPYDGRYGVSFPNDADDGKLPEHPVVWVFDLHVHDEYWINSGFLETYVYDASLGDKLILPTSHRDLLDVLTDDLDAFTSDFIEGKSAGNMILCKGIPGIGKTLTAEIYSELIERPLYAIHSGTLGTTAEAIQRSLEKVFKRAKRWNCVLLLDEADVFVMQRGDDINLNAIVAEFLRTLEYFDGLMFLTTNRPDNIDDAIISRCMAVINYQAPETTLARRSWIALERQFGVELAEDVRDKLLQLFPTIVQRDIKMLLKLVLKMKAKGKGDLDVETFRRCAMFRSVDIKEAA